MDKFEKAFNYMLENEGIDFTDDSVDKGGATQYGISLEFIKSVKLDIDSDGFLNDKDIRFLNLQKAKDIYKKYFWNNLYLQIGDKIAIKIFDMGVNAGSSRSHKLIQKALNSLGEELLVDGVFGQKTINAINSYKESDVLAVFQFEMKKFYEGIVERDATQKRFIKGWLRRLERQPK